MEGYVYQTQTNNPSRGDTGQSWKFAGMFITARLNQPLYLLYTVHRVDISGLCK